MNDVIAAVRNGEDFIKALDSGVKIIFDLAPDIMTVKKFTEEAHERGKKIFVHMDLAKGIAADNQGVMFVKSVGVDGIISTRTHTLKIAREEGLKTVQRFFVVDSRFADTIFESIKSSKADMIEIMPGIVTKVISKLKEKIDTPIIAGGLIETKAEADAAFKAGAIAVSTGAAGLWK